MGFASPKAGGKVLPALSFLVEVVDPLTFGWGVELGEDVLLSQVRPVEDREGRSYLFGATGSCSLSALEKGVESSKGVEIPSYTWRAERLSGPSFQLQMGE